jgi:membrane protease YdiL (CAAX protease family)
LVGSIELVQGVVLVAVLFGGAVLAASLVAVLLGWGDGHPAPPLPPGSHRAVLAATAVAIVGASALSVAVFAAFPGTDSDSTGVFLFISLALDGLLFAMIYFQGIRTGIVTWRSLGLNADALQAGLKWGVPGAIALLAVSAAAGAAMSLLGFRQPQSEWLAWLRDLPGPQLALIFLAAAAAAPIAEELFFRGYVFNAYLAEKGAATAYVASALIFGLVHGHVLLVLAIFPMGLILAYLYRRSGTILAPVIAHMLNNSVAFVGLLGATGS